MSRTRTRPTREDTRERLFEAAAQVFVERGIAAASIESIAAAAGFSRGAFYSNFASKDELIIAMLADHVERSVQRNRELLARHRDAGDFVAALRATDRSGQDPLGREPLLHMELILFAARSARRRPELAKRLRARRTLVTEIVAATNRASGRDVVDPVWAGAVLLALEDGFRLHRLIDPDGTPADSFLRALTVLQEALGVVQPAPAAGRGATSRGARAARAPGRATARPGSTANPS
jgi:AcrR family transcriptional regulator